jgi:hypothetical protein
MPLNYHRPKEFTGAFGRRFQKLPNVLNTLRRKQIFQFNVNAFICFEFVPLVILSPIADSRALDRKTHDGIPNGNIHWPLQRIKELPQLMPRLRQQPIVFFDRSPRLAAVTHNRLMVGHRLAIVHHPCAKTNALQRCGPELPGRRLIGIFPVGALDNAIPGPNVMEKEIAVGMDRLAA